MIATEKKLSLPELAIQVGCRFWPEPLVSQRVMVSQVVAASGSRKSCPPAVAMAKYEPSGEKSTSRIHESNVNQKHASEKRLVFQFASSVALVVDRLKTAAWSRASPPTVSKLPMTTMRVPCGLIASRMTPVLPLATGAGNGKAASSAAVTWPKLW